MQALYLDAKILAAMERISAIVRSELWESAKNFGLTPLQAQILIYTKSNETTVSKLADEFLISKPTVSDAVKTLIGKNLLIRQSAGEDKRSYPLALTPQGREIAEKLRAYTDSFMNGLSNAWLSDKVAILDASTKLIEILERSSATMPEELKQMVAVE